MVEIHERHHKSDYNIAYINGASGIISTILFGGFRSNGGRLVPISNAQQSVPAWHGASSASLIFGWACRFCPPSALTIWQSYRNDDFSLSSFVSLAYSNYRDQPPGNYMIVIPFR